MFICYNNSQLKRLMETNNVDRRRRRKKNNERRNKKNQLKYNI